MKKIVFLLIVLSFLIAGHQALAEENLPDPGTLPDSTFYFLKSWKESIQTFFTFGAENKAEQYLHLADVRLAEYQKMIEKGTLRQAQGKKLEVAEKTLEKYEQQLNRALEKAEEAKEQGKDIEKLATSISETTLRHQEVLNNVLKKVPEEAKKGIENAIEVSQKGFENAIQAVTGEKKEELERKAEEVRTEVEEKIIESKPAEPGVCIQVITPAVSPEKVCKEFPTPCDVPADWKKVDKCPQPTVAPLPVPVSTPAPAQAPIPIPVPAKTSAPATSLVACCSASGGCKLVDTKETCLGMSGKPMSISSCSPNPCSQPTPVYNECKQGPMKDYKCSSGTLVKWQCKCTAEADGEETRLCSVKPASSCPGLGSATSLTITSIDVRHLLWMTKEWTIVDHIFWTTNIPATSYVEYGPTTSYGFTTSPESPTTQHVAQGIPSLERNTIYHFRIIAEDTQGNKIISDDYTFTTGL
ncbi:MAG: DUF5667 domain-containing protein [Patescibacteria group bacterium]